MRTFGTFLAKDGTQFFGELIGEDVHELKRPFWLGLEPPAKKRTSHLEIRVQFRRRS